MEMNDTINDFIADCEGRMIPKSVVTYKYKIESFHKYLLEKTDLSEKNYYFIINGLSQEDIIESIRYYVADKGKRKSVNSRSSVYSYYFTIICFFEYLFDNKKYKIDNTLFDSSKNRASLDTKLENLMNELSLNPNNPNTALTDDEFDWLISDSDYYINNPDTDSLLKLKIENNGKTIYKDSYGLLLSGIILKLMLFTGASSASINKIKTTDYNSILNKIKINEYEVRLPDELSKQMQYYLQIRKLLLEKDRVTSIRLFVQKENISEDLGSGNICLILKKLFKTESTTKVCKYAIIQMIKKDIPQRIIMSFTGYKESVYIACIKEMELKTDDNKLLDIKLRQIDTFDVL